MKFLFNRFLVLISLTILILAVLSFLNTPNTKQKVSNASPSPEATPGVIAIRGVVLCLPHKNTEGPQTLECAYGLKDDEDNYYALVDSDPNYQNISNIEMNKEVLVEGTFNPITNDIYPTLGVITITKISP